MPIHLDFTLTFQDYLQAQRLHIRRILWRRVLRWISMVVYPILGVFGLFFTAAVALNSKTDGDLLVPLTASLILVGIPFYQRYRLKSCYRRTRIDDGRYTLDFSDDVIRSNSANTKGEIGWNAVQTYTEDKYLFMLYLAPAKFIAIPKRICSAEQIDELRSLFQRHIQPKVN